VQGVMINCMVFSFFDGNAIWVTSYLLLGFIFNFKFMYTTGQQN